MQKKFLIIQTAFIGDVVLATGIIEKLHQHFPGASIDFLVRKGNEGLLANHPFLNTVLIWNKKKDKYNNLIKLLKAIRAAQYDKVINVQRYANTGFLTVFSKAKETIGFNKNPWSFLFSRSVKHHMTSKDYTLHEIERNHLLIREFPDEKPAKPTL